MGFAHSEREAQLFTPLSDQTQIRMNQRWREHRTSYRPPQEVICTRHYEVSFISGDTEAKAFVMAHHYLGSYPAARFRFGLYNKGQLCGIAVFSRPTNDLSLTNVFHCDPTLCADLGRFLLLDDVPGNGETFFLGQCFSLLRREGLAGVTKDWTLTPPPIEIVTADFRQARELRADEPRLFLSS